MRLMALPPRDWSKFSPGDVSHRNVSLCHHQPEREVEEECTRCWDPDARCSWRAACAACVRPRGWTGARRSSRSRRRRTGWSSRTETRVVPLLLLRDVRRGGGRGPLQRVPALLRRVASAAQTQRQRHGGGAARGLQHLHRVVHVPRAHDPVRGATNPRCCLVAGEANGAVCFANWLHVCAYWGLDADQTKSPRKPSTRQRSSELKGV